MALFDRNDNRSFGPRGDANRGQGGGGFMSSVRRGWDRVENAFEGQDVHRAGEYGGDDHLRRDYENRSTMDSGAGYGGGMNRGGGWNAGGGGYNRPMDRDGGLHQQNSWSDGAWTADAAERTDREWNTGNRYDRDTNPTQAGWRAGGMHGGGMSGGMGGGMSGGMSGGMGMDRGGMDRDRGWNLGGGEWGHTGNLNGGQNRYDRGYSAGGMDQNRGGGFIDRAQNAVRRGWDNVEDRFDRDDEDRGYRGTSRGGAWGGQSYDRDMHQGGMMGGGMAGGGMNRYSSDYDRGRMGMAGGGRTDWDRSDRGHKSREQTDAGDPYGDRQNHTPIRMVNEGRWGANRGGMNRYDENSYRGGGREWF